MPCRPDRRDRGDVVEEPLAHIWRERAEAPTRPLPERERRAGTLGLRTFLLQHLRNIVLSHMVKASVDDLRHLLSFLDSKEDIHRLLAHLERTLTDQGVGIAVAQEL